MKAIIVFFISMNIYSAYCSKSLKFTSLVDCSTKNIFIEVAKCEIDDIYANIKLVLKTPLVKSTTNVKFDVIQNDKIVQTFNIQKLDWCSVFKDGKVPTNVLWKIVMAGFGKQFSKYAKCPIKNEIVLDRLNADSKMMMFLPSSKINCSITSDMYSGNGAKDFVSIIFTAEISEN